MATNQQFPTLSNAQGQIFPQMTAIRAEYWQTDTRWVGNRIAPVFQVSLPLARMTRWSAADALPTLQGGLLRAKGDTGAQIGIQAPTYEDFFINEGMLTSIVPLREVHEAPPVDPDRPYRVRTKMATGFLLLENESRVKDYYDPTNPLFPAAQLVASSGNWQTYNPATSEIISDDLLAGVVRFTQYANGQRPNFLIIDQLTDTFFLRRLSRERNTLVALGGYAGATPDILPSADGRTVAGMQIIVPGALKETTPMDAVYSPDYVWGNFPYAVLGYSPTLDGRLWDQTGDAYIANAEYVPDGESAYETYRQTDPVIMNKRDFMWWNFNRLLKLIKPELVLAIGPIR
jgi:hypothetical protein